MSPSACLTDTTNETTCSGSGSLFYLAMKNAGGMLSFFKGRIIAAPLGEEKKKIHTNYDNTKDVKPGKGGQF